jgi:hypothetical protein
VARTTIVGAPEARLAIRLRPFDIGFKQHGEVEAHRFLDFRSDPLGVSLDRRNADRCKAYSFRKEPAEPTPSSVCSGASHISCLVILDLGWRSQIGAQHRPWPYPAAL